MGCFHFWVWQTGFDLAGQKSEETEAYMVKYLIATSFTFCLNNKNWIQILNGHKEKAKDGNFYLCSKWDSNFLAKCLVKSHDVNRCKVHYACKVMPKLLNGLAGCWLAGRPTHWSKIIRFGQFGWGPEGLCTIVTHSLASDVNRCKVHAQTFKSTKVCSF